MKTSKENPVKIRRPFDQTFKREAVQNWLASGKSAEAVAQELGLHPNRLYAWKKPGSRADLQARLEAAARENRLVLTESVAGVPSAARMRETWTYLPDGRWVERIVSTNNGSTDYPAGTNRYVWDGNVLLAILDHTNGLVMSFVRGLDLSGTIQGAGGVGGVLAVTFRTNGTHFVGYDGNGNVAALTDASTGANSAVFEYGP